VDKPQSTEENLLIGSFNVKNIAVNINSLQELLEKVHILCIQEHWLYSYELRTLKLINTNFDCDGKNVDMDNPISSIQKPRGYGGTCIFWRKYISTAVQALPDGSPRIQAILVRTHDKPITAICVYMPCRGTNSSREEYAETLDELTAMCERYASNDIIIAGDFNSEIICEDDSRNDFSRLLMSFVNQHDFGLPRLWPKGPKFVHPNGNSQIDYILIPSKLVSKATYLPHSLSTVNTSDHIPVCAEVNCKINRIAAVNAENSAIPQRILWHKIAEDEYRREVDKNMELNINNIDNIDELDAAAMEIMRRLTHSAQQLMPPLPPKKPGKMRLWNPAISSCTKIAKEAHWKWKMLNGGTTH
jgi:exonuclease III